MLTLAPMPELKPEVMPALQPVLALVHQLEPVIELSRQLEFELAPTARVEAKPLQQLGLLIEWHQLLELVG